MSEVLTYAVVGGPPDDWAELEVINLDSGLPVEFCVEVNTVEGWVIVSVRNEARTRFDNVRIEGRFEIRRRATAQ